MSGLPPGWAGYNGQVSLAQVGGYPGAGNQVAPAAPQVSCPMVQTKSGSLTLRGMSFQCDCHIASAIVNMTATWVRERGSGTESGVFVLPTPPEGTVTDVVVYVGQRMYATFVVDSQMAGMQQQQQGGKGKKQKDKLPQSRPGLFTATVPEIRRGEEVRVQCSWFQPMLFYEGFYYLILPTRLEQAPRPDLLSVVCSVNTGVPAPVNAFSLHHPIQTVKSEMGHVQLATARGAPWNNEQFFQVAVEVWGAAIVTSLNVQGPNPANLNDQRGTFCMSISPPNPENTTTFARSVIFLLDHSGSMYGKPLESAKAAILYGLDQLNAYDEFNVIAYNHMSSSMATPDSPLRPGDPGNVDAAKRWVMGVEAGGTTDIMSPLQMALDVLRGARGVPYIFLITDGAVRNEQEIVKHVLRCRKGVPNFPRISTVGIGGYCNHFFLKQLAFVGRGFNEKALTAHTIGPAMQRLLLQMSKPVLKDVEFSLAGLPELELYPFPAPDLFCGAPVIVSGKYGGGYFPPSVTMRGTLPSGEVYDQTLHTSGNATLPLDKVFVKQRLDLLCAKAWLEQSEEIRQQAVALSVQEGMLCAHTSMVTFATTPEKYKQLKDKQRKGTSPKQMQDAVAACAIGGVGALAIIGVGALAMGGMGDVAASLSNLNVGDAMGDMDFDLGDFDFGGMEDALGDIGSALGDAAGAVGSGLGDAASAVGGALGDVGEGMGDAAGAAGDFCGETCETVSEVFSCCLGDE